MVNQCNKANQRQNGKSERKDKSVKRRNTIHNKERTLKRHLKVHDGDNCAKQALMRWNKRY